MATTKKAPAKKAAKKIVKTARKPAPKKVKVKPLNNFLDYLLTTHPSDPDLVCFGCGAVTVSRKDLIAAAEFAEAGGPVGKRLNELRKLMNKEGGFDPIYDVPDAEEAQDEINDIQSEINEYQREIESLQRDIKNAEGRIAKVKGRSTLIKKHKNGLAYFNLNRAARSNYTYESLIRLNPTILRRIAATPEDRIDC